MTIRICKKNTGCSRERAKMASEASSLDSAVSSDGALHMERDNGGYGSVESAVGGPDCRNDYDGLQRDQTLHPMLIRHKHSDSMRRCDHTMKELEYYCGQHIVAMNQLEATSQESSALLGTYGDLVSDKQRLDREVQALQKEVSELRCQNQDVLVANSGKNDTINQHYLSALRKYKAIEDGYDSLKKRYDDLLSSHSSAVNKLELAHEEVARFKKQYEEAIQERNAAFREKNGLKQQCTSAIRQWDIAMRERNEYREALSKVQQQHEDAVKEINQAMMLRMKTSKDMKRLTEERNAALHEYTLIMGERDTVHKEMEKLGDDLSQAYAKITHLENQNKQLADGKKTLSYQIETLRREISSALLDRDEAFKECNVLRQKFGDYSEVASRDYKNRLEIHSYNRERINSSKETECEVNTIRDYSKREKERMDDLDQANLEIDRLRKQVEAVQGELEEAIQEAEVSKRRRDWAFSERDKIVLEREALRSNCDRLRKERDRAVSEFASAIRDSDDIKKQRNEASKELKDLKEMIESDLLTRSSSIYGHHEDNNSNEWDVITIHLDLSRLCQDTDRDLGLVLIGGRQDPYYPNDTGVYVAQINDGSIVGGKLRVNDCIIRVNNVDCTSVSTRMILETLRACTVGSATVTVRRKRSTRRYLRTTQLPIGDTIPHGIALELGIYISKISPGSSAAKDGNLSVGDRVLNINSKPMDSVTSAHEAMSLLNDCIADVLTITTLKGIPLSLASSSETMPDTGVIYGTDSNNKSQKMVNNCSQTEQERIMLKATSDDYERRYMASNFNERSIYKVSKSISGDKPSGISHAWDNIREKIDIVRGRRHSKDRDDKKKQRHRNSSPNTFEQEQDAIAELDSVIESYHQKKTITTTTTATTTTVAIGAGTVAAAATPPITTMTMPMITTATSTAPLSTSINIANNSVLKRNKLRGTEKMEKDGGTWPKVRGGPLIQNGTGTILHPRKTKERLPLSVLINHPPKYESYNYNRISNPIPLGNFSNDIASLEKKPASAEFEPVESGRLSSSQAPSESSIDYSVKSANNDYSHPQKRRLRQYGSNESQPDQPTLQHNRAHSQLYPLAAISINNTSASLATAPRQQQLSGNFSFPPYTLTHSHPHPHQQNSLPSRYPSPPSLPLGSQSGESIGLSDRSWCFEPPYNNHSSHSQAFGHLHTPSVDSPYQKLRGHPVGTAYDVPNAYTPPGYWYEGGTFPRKKENQRFRIPSNPSVVSKSSVGKLSTGSIERTSERGSPMSNTFRLEVLSSTTGMTSTGDDTFTPLPGEIRRLKIDKSVEPLGIRIFCLEKKGVFVSAVSENSLASKVGLQIGDQLLDVCGINLRTADYPSAAKVLRDARTGAITMQVQYNPHKYNELQGTGSSSSPEPGAGADGSHSGSPTPCNSPEAPRKSSLEHHETSEPERDAAAVATAVAAAAATTTGKTTLTLPPVIREREVRTSASMEVRDTQERAREIRNSASLDINIRKPELRNSATIDSIRGALTLTRAQMNQAVTTLQRQNATVRSPTQEEQSRKSPPTIEPRYLFIETRKCSNLGISLVGGNGVGIFVHSVQPGCLAEDAGLRSGDRILEYNGVDLRQATAEQAALELARPADKVTLVAQYMPERYNEVKDKPGDSFYVKAMFDRVGEVGDSLQLRFNKDDVLYVDNTMFNGTPGHWRAWLVDQAGRRQQCGIIPSKFKIEEELLLRRSLGDLETDTGKRGTTSARRSFFRRKKHHRSSSRDSKELSTLTGVSLGWYSDSGTLNEENLPASYQRVERLDYPTLRPVLIIGPLSECVATKLLQDCPGDFTRCLPEAMHCSQATLEQGLRDSLYVDYRKKGSYFECTTVQAVKDVCAKNSHCILDVSIASIERLHRHQIYPIVLLIKFKSVKQIKEVKDSRYPSDKISAKAAKEMHEQSLKIEAEYKHYISDIIHAGVNVAYICTQVKAAVDCEQSKALWVPRGPP
ncbi:disks large homolog 5 isoform X2 [Diachasma alloeum]|uniref:disks large homolog 5 isoform X2 n=1 Tax=Diachasma alloeum TaxID=454923 RepID=UPI000738344C|nr:disks large homolog 5 isoform X2 [Diachasma alloeum]